MKTSTRKVSLTATFVGRGRVVKLKNGAFDGGVPTPRIPKGGLSFSVCRMKKDEDGNFNPVTEGSALRGAFQVDVVGNSRGFRALAAYLLSLSELDTSADKGFHEHIDNVKSSDGNVELEIIVRKRPS